MLDTLFRRVDLMTRTHQCFWSNQRPRRLRLRILPTAAELIATVRVVTEGQEREVKLVRNGEHWYCDPYELNSIPMHYRLEPADATWTPLTLRFDLDQFAAACTGEPTIAQAEDAELLRSRLCHFLTDACVIWQGRLLYRLTGIPTLAIMSLPAPDLGAEQPLVFRLVLGDSTPGCEGHFMLDGYDHARALLEDLSTRHPAHKLDVRVGAVILHRPADAWHSRAPSSQPALESA